MQQFRPLFRNAHLATIAGNFWRRPKIGRWPVKAALVRTTPDVQVMMLSQWPAREPKGEILLVHGLEGSSAAGYEVSMACAALEHGYAVHRLNMRGCGGTDHLSLTSYHAGQTWDVLAVLRERKETSGAPLFLIGFSLGGNVALKLAGELGPAARELLSGVCAISAPIDLAACAAALELPCNVIYRRRFVKRLKERIRRRHLQAPEIYTLEHLPKIRTIIDFDNYYTARLFGFGTAANYFKTQSANQFLDRIEVPALVVQAKDDPLIPFSAFDHAAFSSNPYLQLEAVEHGGHLGFLARGRPRFWLDEMVLEWIDEISNKRPAARVS
ncbi:MAG TPA: alpha/beta fold hydrolase [Bryobacteraceae bacterium]|nr:alpha/beta fold hydrolase [Bryobacteraceae bacterium]